MDKLSFEGQIISIQPRIRLTRSFDESSHNYLGYAIIIEGAIDGDKRVFSIGIGKAAHKKHHFKKGDVISGAGALVADKKKEPVEYYKVSKLKKLTEVHVSGEGPPWETIPPELEVYRQRGRRRLAARTYDTKCLTCIWGCRMPVEIIIDHWNPGRKKYRFETFCYGPLSCIFYKPGPKRKVEGRKGMVYEEEDWVDEMAVEHRDPHE